MAFTASPHLLVGNADHRHVGDRRMAEQRVLDFGRIDVLAAGDDHVLHAVVDVEVAVRVEIAGVAGVEPAVADGACAVASGWFQ